MKRILCATFLLLAIAGQAAIPVERTEGLDTKISRELEYVDGVIEKGVSDGNIEKLIEAHRTLSNLAVTLNTLDDNRKRTLFTLAIAFSYVKMCPSAYVHQLSSPGGGDGFSINCGDVSLKYFEEGKNTARTYLDRTAEADSLFITGVGLDRLKANLAGVKGAGYEKYFDLAKENIRKAVKLGTNFDGAEAMLARMDREEYLKSPLIDDDKFREISRTLFVEGAFPSAAVAEKGSTFEKAPMKSEQTPPVVDGDTFLDYKWRFSITKPDDTWEFDTGSAGGSFLLSIRLKDTEEQRGSGLNIICHSLAPEEISMSVEQIVAKSVALLEQAGYVIEEKKAAKHAGYPAYQVISTHKYNELIPAGQTALDDGTEAGLVTSESLVSRQFMTIILKNGIQYIVSFSSLEMEYPRIFGKYSEIADTLKLF